jgi:hypothetical protein|eukprot:COSAG06_NODE_947_length_11359_cov_13.054707_5_plen_86_part_00
MITLKATTCSSTFAHAHRGRGMCCSSTQKSAGPGTAFTSKTDAFKAIVVLNYNLNLKMVGASHDIIRHGRGPTPLDFSFRHRWAH